MNSRAGMSLLGKFVSTINVISRINNNLLVKRNSNTNNFQTTNLFSLSTIKYSHFYELKRNISKTVESDKEEVHAPPLTKDTAHTLVLRLNSEERATLLSTLQHFESEQIKAQFKGELAAFRWRSKFGRPSKVPRLGDVDPTGSYCPVPEDWLLRKYAESVPKPTSGQLVGVAIHNAVPFIGFGFLDNFFMIVCGDYIEQCVGTYMVISTMAAAALGNTLSDVLGLGCAAYVEMFAAKLGVKAPPLSPIQIDMKSSRFAANLGRSIGVCIGCILGMTPLLILSKKSEDTQQDEATNPETIPATK
uniref:Transmembrane protein 65 n=2 Tax=Clastoptera arizonana TaxID=38151 RepID=A0A1B6E828_9HEMI